MGTPEHQTCQECGESIMVVPIAPGDQSMRMDPTPKRLWRLVAVSPDFKVAVPTDVYESHIATCKKLNRT